MMLRAILMLGCLLLGGCRFETGLTTVTNLSIEGRAVNATRSYVVGSEGEFECLRSVTGSCHYVLFVEDCAADAPPGTGCGARVVDQFTLAAGERQHKGELPRGLRQCVDHEAPPVVPACAAGQARTGAAASG
ncbi:hypothetical protein QFW77_18940 [Luteimonas sp. RD2P54]|uniref:Lipoprotein n=1 Tax=Luteimonas endophytica TaxID=3042023 RepID=A0ABT6JDY9_9GAMM|nr:hypothetical protein [Luteimonas endophytica]MDH5825047.1 hypothetical protein [Luteimonas endophytica]